MFSGGTKVPKTPSALMERTENYWAGRNQERGLQEINLRGLENKIATEGEDKGRYVLHYELSHLIHDKEDPRIKWVNDEGAEVNFLGKPLKAKEAASEYAKAPPAPPPEWGDTLIRGANQFAELDALLSAQKKTPDPGIDGDTYGRIYDTLDGMRSGGNVGIRNLGGSERMFDVGGNNYEPLAMCGDVDGAKGVAQKLTEDFGSALGGDFGVVSKGRMIYVMSPANMKELKAKADDKGKLPNGMKIH